MVRLTLNLMTKKSLCGLKKKKEESHTQYFQRLTHLYLENKSFDKIDNDQFLQFKNLMVLYLYDNLLTTIPNLKNNINLTHLYLQNNKIEKIENLQTLSSLNKLYLGDNSIALVEGLENLHSLLELHIEKQNLPPSESLLFDSRSIVSISKTLSVINISGNNMYTLMPLGNCMQLIDLNASNNDLNNLEEILQLIQMKWTRLIKLDLSKNPVTQIPKYKDKIIITAKSIDNLDGKNISETLKQFLKNWQANKELFNQKSSEQLPSIDNTDYFNDYGDAQNYQKQVKYQIPYMMSSIRPQKLISSQKCKSDINYKNNRQESKITTNLNRLHVAPMAKHNKKASMPVLLRQTVSAYTKTTIKKF